MLRTVFAASALATLGLGTAPTPGASESLLTVSYDPHRKLFRDLSEAFTAFSTA